MNSDRSRAICLNTLIVFLLCLIYITLLRKAHIYVYDEGEIIAPTLRIARGQVIYRDFFTFRPPGLHYLMALIYWLSGFKNTVTETVIILNLALTATFTFALGRMLLGSTLWAFFPALFFLTYGPYNWFLLSPHWFSALCLLISIYFLLRHYHGERRLPYLMISGAFTGSAILMLHPPGMLFWCFVILLQSIDGIITSQKIKTILRDIMTFSSAVLLPIIPFAIYLFLNGAIHDAVYDTVIWVMENYSKMGRYPEYFYPGKLLLREALTKFGILKGLFQTGWVLMLGYAPLLTYILSPLVIIKLYKTDRASAGLLIFYYFTGLSIFLSSLYRSDITHLLFQIPVTMILFFYLIRFSIAYCLASKLFFTRLAGIIPVFAIILCLPYLFYNFIIVQYTLHTANIIKVHTPAGGFYIRDGQKSAELWNNLFAALHGVRDKEIFVYAHAPNLYFDLGVINPTRYDYAMTGQFTEKQRMEIIQSLEKSKPEFVVYDRIIERILSNPAMAGYPMTDLETIKKDRVREYIFSNYRPLPDFILSGLIIMRRIE